jgi:hypothetical protein
MLLYGGMNDFNKLLGDLIVYDFEKDEWLEFEEYYAGEINPKTY